ncbi:MAG: 3-hydroxylacyl-ACP dehydratase, partial [Methylophilus sp.]|nr:3-hydroxylacyl-ACP dehydratase [Methylophilus sp.]
MLNTPASLESGTSLDHTWIASHIPHQGDMCLLEHVQAWDTLNISCIATSHRSVNNPLRSNEQL